MAAQVIIAILSLETPYSVVATVRDEIKGTQTKEALRSKLGDKVDNLSFAVVPDIEADDAFKAVMDNNDFVAVLHTATPFHLRAKDPKEITGPAIGSTKSILKTANGRASIKRVIITSSFASIVDLPQGTRPGYKYTEKDWHPITWEKTHSGDPVDAYYGAKTWAERAAWDFVKEENPTFELITLCPPMVFGEVAQYIKSADQLNTSSASLYNVLVGKDKEVSPQAVMIWVNVKDLAKAHALAIAAPGAGNHRFLIAGDQPYTNKEISDAFIKHFPEFAPKVPTKLPEGVDANGVPIGGRYTGDNSLSKQLLGMTYQNFEDTMVQFADSVKNLPATSA